MDTVLEDKHKTMKERAREHLITIFGDKLKLVPSHAERRSREINRQIDRQLWKDKRKQNLTLQFLLLGPESARSEVFCRFRQKAGKPFSEAERRDSKVPVLRRIILTMKCLLERLECISIEYEPNPTTSTSSAMLDDDEVDILRAIERLWNDSNFQSRLNKSSECLALLREVSLSVLRACKLIFKRRKFVGFPARSGNRKKISNFFLKKLFLVSNGNMGKLGNFRVPPQKILILLFSLLIRAF